MTKALLPALDGAFGDHADALRVADQTTSWAALATRADAVAARIAGAPVVALSGTATLDTVVGIVAALRSGTPVVPVPSDAGPM